ncbi:MAG: hypothetical protein IPH93_07240 [Saprospiraceae bacterium]|nr:hypothetical protein [Saprospiraceae bacterium]MBK9630732.1 hypothetical protein [Saprospiraceae bacterium]
MKLLQFFLLFLVQFLLSSCNDLSNTANTSYYFCFSFPKNHQKQSTINYLLYTDIVQINGDEQAIKEKSAEWYEVVKTKCRSNQGCNSDLSYYKTIQEATTSRNQLVNKYKNHEKYILEKVEFK